MGETQNRWFIRENPDLKWMMTGGTPILGNPHMGEHKELRHKGNQGQYIQGKMMTHQWMEWGAPFSDKATWGRKLQKRED